MALSLSESITAIFAVLAVVNITSNPSALDQSDMARTFNQNLPELEYCDADCQSQLGSVGKMVKAIVEKERKRHGKGDDAPTTFVIDDPVQDSVEYFIALPDSQTPIVALYEPEKT